MIIDSHCHAWARWPYQPQVPDVDSRGRVQQLLFEMDQNGVDMAVVICARIGQNPDNNEYVVSEAARYEGRFIPFPDVDSSWSSTYHTAGAAERLEKIARQWKVKGFTHYLKSEPDEWLRSSQGREFFAVATQYGLIASISGGPGWQPELREIAAAFPRLTILCHHLGGLRPRSATYDSDLKQLMESAALANIMVKVSGFYYGSASEWDFPYRDSIGMFERIYTAFGSDRLCWGSDFPVCNKGRCTYRQTLEVVRAHCPFIPKADMHMILGDALGRRLVANQQERTS
ncbi:MAG: amidohydrolase [Chloroflexi bacterium]|nr:amidohydrolase [Chloroflexota bacterium]